jgi:ATP-dependent DNA ligase
MWNREPQHKRLIADNRWLPASMHVRHVPTVLTKTNTERRALYSEYLSAGYEGMIARLPDARYAPGKRILWKIKPLWD